MTEVYDNRGVQQVELSGTVGATYPTPASTQTPVTKSGDIDNGVANTNVTMYTPTNGKSLYITQMTVSWSAAGQIAMGDNLSGLPFANGFFYVRNAAAGQMQISFPQPVKISTALKGRTTDASVSWSFTGYEVSN